MRVRAASDSAATCVLQLCVLSGGLDGQFLAKWPSCPHVRQVRVEDESPASSMISIDMTDQ